MFEFEDHIEEMWKEAQAELPLNPFQIAGVSEEEALRAKGPMEAGLLRERAVALLRAVLRATHPDVGSAQEDLYLEAAEALEDISGDSNWQELLTEFADQNSELVKSVQRQSKSMSSLSRNCLQLTRNFFDYTAAAMGQSDGLSVFSPDTVCYRLFDMNQACNRGKGGLTDSAWYLMELQTYDRARDGFDDICDEEALDLLRSRYSFELLQDGSDGISVTRQGSSEVLSDRVIVGAIDYPDIKGLLRDAGIGFRLTEETESQNRDDLHVGMHRISEAQMSAFLPWFTATLTEGEPKPYERRHLVSMRVDDEGKALFAIEGLVEYTARIDPPESSEVSHVG